MAWNPFNQWSWMSSKPSSVTFQIFQALVFSLFFPSSSLSFFFGVQGLSSRSSCASVEWSCVMENFVCKLKITLTQRKIFAFFQVYIFTWPLYNKRRKDMGLPVMFKHATWDCHNSSSLRRGNRREGSWAKNKKQQKNSTAKPFLQPNLQEYLKQMHLC